MITLIGGNEIPTVLVEFDNPPELRESDIIPVCADCGLPFTLNNAALKGCRIPRVLTHGIE